MLIVLDATRRRRILLTTTLKICLEVGCPKRGRRNIGIQVSNPHQYSNLISGRGTCRITSLKVRNFYGT
ncbi:hypothetical protein Golob_027637 [Gossypium lobatum]|uniref:Uncharacterized protein n=1 Tax=Gossypium lobatum TaxID=34289 RepID=A0A7J8NFN1_9ROSI|nr:hypothetical protein [Gossypium lobatum]